MIGQVQFHTLLPQFWHECHICDIIPLMSMNIFFFFLFFFFFFFPIIGCFKYPIIGCFKPQKFEFNQMPKLQCERLWNLNTYFLSDDEAPPRQVHFVYSLMLSKPRTCEKRLLHTDRVILCLCRQTGPTELFAPKGIHIYICYLNIVQISCFNIEILGQVRCLSKYVVHCLAYIEPIWDCVMEGKKYF